MSADVRLVEQADQRLLLDEVTSSTRSGQPCAVLDPTWPAGIRSAARAAVSRAASQGRVTDGDLVVFTSGSTGRPRGVVRRLSSWTASVDQLAALVEAGPAPTTWLPGPLWSSLFLYGAWHTAVLGGRVLTRDENPTPAEVVHCVPGQLDRVMETSLPRLRTVVVAGDRLSGDARMRCETKGLRLVEYYGAAELSFVAWRDAETPMRPFPGAKTQVRDGQLWVRSPYLAHGYLDPEDVGPLRAGADGWATVGDLARETDGGIEVLGRGDAAVTTGGHTVVVEEVEQALRAVPGVVDVAVAGVPSARLGQVLVAVVVGTVDDDTLRTAARSLPGPARPRRFLRADALPRNGSGKLSRPDLAALATRLAAP